MKIEEMRDLDVGQLLKYITEWEKELFKESVIRDRNKKAKQPHLFSKIRRQIARAHTVINQKSDKIKG